MTNKTMKTVSMVLACLFVAITITSSLYVEQSNVTDYKYIKSDSYHSQVINMYEELCIYSSVYLRNKNNDGIYEGSKYLLSDFKKFLYSNQYKYNNLNDDIELVSDKFNFYISMKNKKDKINYLTNITNKETLDILGSSDPELDKIKYLEKKYKNYIERYDDNIISDIDYGDDRVYYYPNIFTGSGDSYETYNSSLVPIGIGLYDNYGRYTFNYGNQDEIIFYNFKKNESNKYIVDDVLPDEEQSYSYDYTGDEDFYVDNENTETNILENADDYTTTELDDSGMTIFIAPKSDFLNTNAAAYTSNYHKFRFAISASIISSILSVIFIVYLFIVCGCHSDSNNVHYRSKTKYFGKIHTEVYFLIMFAVLTCASVIIYLMYSDLFFESVRMTYLVGTFLLMILFALGFGSVLEVVIKFKTKSFLEDSLINKFIKWLITQYHKTAMYRSYCEKSMGSKLESRTVKIVIAVIICLIICLFNPLSSGTIMFNWFILVVCALIIGVCEYRNFKDYRQLNILSKQIDSLGKNEELEEKIESDSSLYNDSKKLEMISSAIKESVEEQIKSERMKIELIANVSHDLKTPLTSIIGYIDLLKKIDMNDEASSYVKIIDKKSEKLKSIVADVFTLAKATSGIDINMEKLDFVMLFNQAFADAYDKINASGKVIKTDIAESSAYIMGDGEKLYRVFQNLIDNALNYSMDGTRIFIKIYKQKDNIIFETKNVSSYPIEFTADEIVERFARGDKSRTDGGSGLGLSIAKSFTEACGGIFKIELDADVFKTIVSMPIIKETENTEQEEDN